MYGIVLGSIMHPSGGITFFKTWKRPEYYVKNTDLDFFLNIVVSKLFLVIIKVK